MDAHLSMQPFMMKSVFCRGVLYTFANAIYENMRGAVLDEFGGM